MGLPLSSPKSTAPELDAPSTQARQQGGGESSAPPSLPTQLQVLGDLDGPLYSLSCSVNWKPFPVFGSSLRPFIGAITGRGKGSTLGGLTPCPLLPSKEALYSVGDAVAQALSLRNEGTEPSPHSSAFLH